MRILFDGTLLRRTHTGLATMASAYLRQAALQPNDDVHVLCPPGYADRHPSVTFHDAPSKSEGGRIYGQHVVLPLLERKINPDITLLFNPYSPALGSRSVNRLAFVADMRHLRSPDQFSKYQRLYRRAAWPVGIHRAAHTVAISHFALSEVLEFFPRAVERASVIHCGCDHVDDWKTVRSTDFPMPYALHLAQRSNKGTSRVLEAWRIFRRLQPDSPLILRIVGANEELLASVARDETIVASSSLDSTLFHSVFAGAACLIFVSDYEGFGLPVAEAARLSIPVIATRVPAVNEECIRAAHVLPSPFSTDELAEAKDNTFKNRVALGQQARTSTTMATWEIAYRKLRHIIEGLR